MGSNIIGIFIIFKFLIFLKNFKNIIFGEILWKIFKSMKVFRLLCILININIDRCFILF